MGSPSSGARGRLGALSASRCARCGSWLPPTRSPGRCATQPVRGLATPSGPAGSARSSHRRDVRPRPPADRSVLLSVASTSRSSSSCSRLGARLDEMPGGLFRLGGVEPRPGRDSVGILPAGRPGSGGACEHQLHPHFPAVGLAAAVGVGIGWACPPSTLGAAQHATSNDVRRTVSVAGLAGRCVATSASGSDQNVRVPDRRLHLDEVARRAVVEPVTRCRWGRSSRLPGRRRQRHERAPARRRQPRPRHDRGRRS